jgi:hypothetical protein
VERCLACEAVVNRKMRHVIPFPVLRSMVLRQRWATCVLPEHSKTVTQSRGCRAQKMDRLCERAALFTTASQARQRSTIGVRTLHCAPKLQKLPPATLRVARARIATRSVAGWGCGRAITPRSRIRGRGRRRERERSGYGKRVCKKPRR